MKYNKVLEESIDLYNICNGLLGILAVYTDDFYYVSDVENHLENYISLYKDGHESDKQCAIRELQFALKSKTEILKIEG